MRIAAVDLVSNTCFPALAADALGCFRDEGLKVNIGLEPMLGSTKALRDGRADAMIAGSVFDVLTEFSAWKGVKIAVALSQGTPWLLTTRSDLAAERGDTHALRGLRLAAAEGPDLVFKELLRSAGLEPGRDVEVIALDGAQEQNVSFGVFAGQALINGEIDGFWSNAMGAETAVVSGAGKIHIDVRRGEDPADIRFATFAGLVTTDEFLAREPEVIDAAVRGIVKAQSLLRKSPGLAREVGVQLFPPEFGVLIANVIERDTPFYDPVITEEAVTRLNSFAQTVGQLNAPVAYDLVVAVQCQPLWGGN